MSNRVAVASSDFIRNVGRWQSEALRQPIYITHHGRDRLVLAAPDDFKALAGTAEADAVQAEYAALKAANENLLESVSEGYLAIDRNLEIQAANGIVAALVGAARESLRGRRIRDAFPELLALILVDRLQRVFRSGKVDSFETNAFDMRSYSVRMFPIPSGAGVLFHNLTDERELTRAREDALGLEAALAANADVSLIKLDASLRFVSADAKFAEWTGFRPEDLVGHRLTEIVIGADRQVVLGTLEGAVRSGEAGRTPLVVICRRGDELPCKIAVAPILTDFLPRGVCVLLTRR